MRLATKATRWIQRLCGSSAKQGSHQQSELRGDGPERAGQPEAVGGQASGSNVQDHCGERRELRSLAPRPPKPEREVSALLIYTRRLEEEKAKKEGVQLEKTKGYSEVSKDTMFPDKPAGSLTNTSTVRGHVVMDPQQQKTIQETLHMVCEELVQIKTQLNHQVQHSQQIQEAVMILQAQSQKQQEDLNEFLQPHDPDRAADRGFASHGGTSSSSRLRSRSRHRGHELNAFHSEAS